MKSDRLYLVHMMECIERIERYTEAGKQSFFTNSMSQQPPA